MNTETTKAYAQIAKLNSTITKQTKEISLLVQEYTTMKILCGIVTGIVIIESVALMMLLKNTL